MTAFHELYHKIVSKYMQVVFQLVLTDEYVWLHTGITRIADTHDKIYMCEYFTSK